MCPSYPWDAVADLRSRLIEFALSLPGAFEDHPWDETVAKVSGSGKVFVFFGSAKAITVKLDESHAHALSLDGAQPTGYGLGKAGWVTIPLAGGTFEVLRDFVEESYRIVAPKRLVATLDG
jgi:predicted DNA-binding protein (MmcQ/YjbR family)